MKFHWSLPISTLGSSGTCTEAGLLYRAEWKNGLIEFWVMSRQIPPDRIILLGDVKHNVPQVSWQEKDEIPRFLETLAEYAHVDIFPGNHDGGIELLFNRQKNIRVHSARGAVLDGVGYFHGHTWPAPELLAASNVVTAHNHPTVRFTDAFGYSIVEPAWVRTKFKPDVLKCVS